MKATLLFLALVCLSIPRFTALAADDITEIQMVPRLTIRSTVGSVNKLEYSTNLSQPNWATLTTVVVTQSPYWFVDIDAPPSPVRFYRVSPPKTNNPQSKE